MPFLIFLFSDWLTPWCLGDAGFWLEEIHGFVLHHSFDFKFQDIMRANNPHSWSLCMGVEPVRSNKETPKKVIAAMTWCFQRCFALWEQHAILQPPTPHWLPDDARQHAIGHILKDGHRLLVPPWKMHCKDTKWQNVTMTNMILTHCWRHPALCELMTQPQPHRIVRSLVWSLCWHNVGIFGYSLASCSASC